MLVVLRLGFRLLRGAGRAGWVRLGLMIIGAGIASACVLTVFGTRNVIAAREARAQAREPNLVSLAPASAAGVVGGDAGAAPAAGAAADAALVVEVLRETVQGRPSTRVLVGPGHSDLLPPGVSVLPRPGQSVLSPALARLLQTDHGLQARFGSEPIGSVGPAGLTDPEELYAYVGLPQPPLGGGQLASFGVSRHVDIELEPNAVTLLQTMMLFFVALPLAVFFSICWRLSAASRNLSLASLRLAGLSASSARRVCSVEAAVVAASGFGLGVVLHRGVNGWLAGRGIGGMRWRPGDALLSPVLGDP